MSIQPTDIENIGRLYARLMEEIKRRVQVVQQVLNGTWVMPQMVAFELCYVQLRKICETFAIACLTAHGDIPGVRTKLMQKTYNADLIIKQLGSLHPEFYPVPTQLQLHPVTAEPIKTVNIESGFLTKEDLLNLYGECGNYLHRGSIRQIVTNWEPTIDFEKIKQWVDKIIKLLNHHQIQTSDPHKQIWVLMHDKDKGKVHWHLMQMIDPSEIPQDQMLRLQGR
jgi:hypothetical protein